MWRVVCRLMPTTLILTISGSPGNRSMSGWVENGPSLLLLHAAWGDAEMSWGSVWTPLSGTFRVMAPDLPGFRQSSGIPCPSFRAMAEWLQRLLVAL